MKDFLRSPSSIAIFSGAMTAIVSGIFEICDEYRFYSTYWGYAIIYSLFYPFVQAVTLIVLPVLLITRRSRLAAKILALLFVAMVLFHSAPTVYILYDSSLIGRELYLVTRLALRLWVGVFQGVVLAYAYGCPDLIKRGILWGVLGSLPWALTDSLILYFLENSVPLEELSEFIYPYIIYTTVASCMIQCMVTAIPFQKVYRAKVS